MKKLSLPLVLCLIHLFSFLNVDSQVIDHKSDDVSKGQFLPFKAKQRSYSINFQNVIDQHINQPKSFMKSGLNSASSGTVTVLFEEDFEGTLSGWTLGGDWEIGEPTSGPSGSWHQYHHLRSDQSWRIQPSP